MATRRPHSTQFFKVDSRQSASVPQDLAEQIDAFTEKIRDKALRSAVYAGAKVLYDEMHNRVDRLSKDGVLKGSLYHWHDDKRSVNGKQFYLIGPNKGEARHWYNVEYGHWRVNKLIPLTGDTPGGKYTVVVGHNGQKYIATKQRLPQPVWTPAYPYIRPTWDAKATAAVQAMLKRLPERIAELQNGAE